MLLLVKRAAVILLIIKYTQNYHCFKSENKLKKKNKIIFIKFFFVFNLRNVSWVLLIFGLFKFYETFIDLSPLNYLNKYLENNFTISFIIQRNYKI